MEKPDKIPEKIVESDENVIETPKKPSIYVKLRIKYSKVKEFVKYRIIVFLTKYGKFEMYDEDALRLEHWIFDNYKKPTVEWLFQIIATSIPIALMLLMFIGPKTVIIPVSLGSSMAWWLLIEIRKDWNKVKR